MRSRNARGSWHWIRSNLFDGWQVVGTIGLLIGTSLVVALVLNAKHRLPNTNAAIQLVHTIGSDAQHLLPEASPSAEPSASPSAEPSAAPSPDQTGVSQAQPAVKPTAVRSIRRPPPTATSQPSGGNPGPTATATPEPTPIGTVTCLLKYCPTPPPMPTPTPSP